MVQIWVMDPAPCGDHRLPHYYFPPKILTPDQLKQLTGVMYWKVNLEDKRAMKQRIDVIYQERGYIHDDHIIFSPEATPDYENKIKSQYETQRVAADVARLVTEGSGFFDVQDDSGKWFRIHVESGDCVVVPPGRAHRFSTDTKNFIKMRRFYTQKNVI